jgi:hypothetical protein
MFAGPLKCNDCSRAIEPGTWLPANGEQGFTYARNP